MEGEYLIFDNLPQVIDWQCTCSCPRHVNLAKNIVIAQRLFIRLFTFTLRSVAVMFQLHIAAANGYVSVVEFLLDHHVSTDVRDKDEWQPAHAAACWGHVSFFAPRKLQMCRLSYLKLTTLHKVK